MKAFAGVFVLLVFSYVCVWGGGDVAASDGGDRWFTSTPILQAAAPEPENTLPFCPTAYRDASIVGESAKKKTCMYDGSAMRLGTYIGSGQMAAAVAFTYDANMHVLRGVCEAQSCQYSADKDLLVTQRRLSFFVRSVAVYTHVSQRIQRSVNAGSGAIEYVFGGGLPDYELKNTTGEPISVGAFALSKNGTWLAVEMRDRGTALINTDTFTARHVVFEGYRYGYGMDPTEEIAVSDDGLNIIVTGPNAGFNMMNVSSDCGQPIIGDLAVLPGKRSCAVASVGISNIPGGFRTGSQPMFHRSGQSFSMTVLTQMGVNTRVTFAAAGSAVVSSIGLLSLGDSFVSGEGETNESFYLDHTNTGLDTCHVSSRSYPFLLATSMDLEGTEVKSVACSGARMSDIMQATGGYRGQGNRLSTTDISQVEIEQAQQQAVKAFWPGKATQSSFVETYTPQVLTIGIGGNDAGLMGKIRVCAMPGTCEWATSEGRQKTAGEILGLYDRLATLYEGLFALSPTSRVYAVGYSDVMSPDGVCDPVTTLLFSHDERVYMQESIRYLNQVIAAAAAKAGIGYINIQEAFRTKKLCDSLVSPAMNGFVWGDDVPLIASLPLLKLVSAGSFHPKPTGHQLIANSITSAYPPLGQFLWCANQTLRCPFDISPPQASDYWQVSAGQQVARAYVDTFAAVQPASPQQLHVSLPLASFQPGSEVRIELRSDTTILGSLQVDSFGGVDGTVAIPAATPSGYHTLHVMGSSVDGGAVDIYQFVTIGEVAGVQSVVSTEPTEAITPSNDVGDVVGAVTAQARVIDDAVRGDVVSSSGMSDAAVLGTYAQIPTVGGALIAPTGTSVAGHAPVAVTYLLHRGWLWAVVAGLLLLAGVVVVLLVYRQWSKRGSSV